MPMDWTPPPKGTGSEPDLNKVVEDLKNRFGGKKPKGLWIILVLVLVVVLGASSYYTVGTEETGVVQRFGKYDRETGPGLAFKLPLGIEQVTKIKTRRIYKMEFGHRTIKAGERTRFSTQDFSDVSLMLSGDLNVVNVTWSVHYRIQDPKKYLFAVRDPEKAIWDLSQSVMRSIVGDSYAESVLTQNRKAIGTQAKIDLQKLLDQYDTGILVNSVQMNEINPPGPVRPSFNEVNEARQQKERMINEAQEAYNREIPKAQGDAKRVVSEAEGYATETINRAEGEANRFNSVLTSYRQARDVTKRRMYLDALQEMIAKASRVYVVDDKVKGILPHLSLNPGQGKGK